MFSQVSNASNDIFLSVCVFQICSQAYISWFKRRTDQCCISTRTCTYYTNMHCNGLTNLHQVLVEEIGSFDSCYNLRRSIHFCFVVLPSVRFSSFHQCLYCSFPFAPSLLALVGHGQTLCPRGRWWFFLLSRIAPYYTLILQIQFKQPDKDHSVQQKITFSLESFATRVCPKGKNLWRWWFIHSVPYLNKFNPARVQWPETQTSKFEIRNPTMQGTPVKQTVSAYKEKGHFFDVTGSHII